MCTLAEGMKIAVGRVRRNVVFETAEGIDAGIDPGFDTEGGLFGGNAGGDPETLAVETLELKSNCTAEGEHQEEGNEGNKPGAQRRGDVRFARRLPGIAVFPALHLHPPGLPDAAVQPIQSGLSGPRWFSPVSLL